MSWVKATTAADTAMIACPVIPASSIVLSLLFALLDSFGQTLPSGRVICPLLRPLLLVGECPACLRSTAKRHAPSWSGYRLPVPLRAVVPRFLTALTSPCRLLPGVVPERASVVPPLTTMCSAMLVHHLLRLRVGRAAALDDVSHADLSGANGRCPNLGRAAPQDDLPQTLAPAFRL